MSTFSTRAKNILDLCFTTHPNTVLSCESAPGLSDHDAILINFQTQLYGIKQNPRKTHLCKQLTGKIREKLSNISDICFNLNDTSSPNINYNLSFFAQNFQQILSDHVPSKTLGRRLYLPWMSVSLKQLIQKNKECTYNKARLLVAKQTNYIIKF